MLHWGSAVESWNAVHASGRPIAFIAQLGDLIDGQNKKLKSSHQALDACMQVVQKSTVHDWHHAISNHELYNFKRASSDPVPWTSYHSWKPCEGVIAVQIDAYDIAVMGRDDGHPLQKRAWEIIEAENPNDCRAFGVNWKTGLSGPQSRFLPYNGAMGKVQLEWFRDIVAQASSRGDAVIVFSHLPVLPRAATYDTLMWNYREVLDIITAHNDTVVAWFAGHQHSGGVSVEGGTLHYTLASPLEVPSATCHALVEIARCSNGRVSVVVRGSGASDLCAFDYRFRK